MREGSLLKDRVERGGGKGGGTRGKGGREKEEEEKDEKGGPRRGISIDLKETEGRRKEKREFGIAWTKRSLCLVVPSGYIVRRSISTFHRYVTVGPCRLFRAISEGEGSIKIKLLPFVNHFLRS